MNVPDPIIKLYFETIKANTDAFKTYYYGDPAVIPQMSLPAIIGSRVATSVRPGSELSGSSEDEHQITMTFNVVTDIRKEFSPDMTKVPGWASLYDIVEGRDPDSATLDLKKTSLLYILRHNIAMAQNIWTDVKTPTRVKYGVKQNRQPGHWSLEAIVTVTATLIQTR